MKRHMLWGTFALVAIALALTATVATAAEEQPFKAVIKSFTYVEYHAGYNIFDVTGSGALVGNYSAESGAHFSHGFTQVNVYFNITASNGDLLYIIAEQTGSLATASTWFGPFTIVGGTGKFADAHGGGILAVTSDANGFPLGGEFDGTISF